MKNSLSDLKQELKIRNISLPSRHAMMETSTISETSSPSKDIKNSTMDSSNVSKINDLNDSKNNNNLSLNASMDNTTSTLSLNNSSMLDMTLHNSSCGAANATSSTQKSHNDSFHNKSSQSVLKCMIKDFLRFSWELKLNFQLFLSQMTVRWTVIPSPQALAFPLWTLSLTCWRNLTWVI